MNSARNSCATENSLEHGLGLPKINRDILRVGTHYGFSALDRVAFTQDIGQLGTSILGFSLDL